MPVRVYRERYTTEPPPHAEQRPGKRGVIVVRWKARGGKAIEGELLPSGKVRVEVRDVWYYSYTGPDGVTVKGQKGYADKAATEALAIRKQVAADRQQAGLDPPSDPAHGGKSLRDHLRDYIEFLRTVKGRAETHVRDTEQRVAHVLTATAARTAGELTEGAVGLAIAALKQPTTDKLGRRRKPIGKSTANGYLGAVKAFLTWCRRENRIPANPLADVVRETDKTDLRRRRRRLTDAEFARVLERAGQSVRLRKRGVPHPSGEARAVLYLVAAYTGYRAQELAALTPESFALDHKFPHITLPAKVSKRGREDVIPLPPDVVPRVRAFLADKPSRKPVWPGKWFRRAAAMIRDDLAACSPPIPYQDHRGRYADFHSLRRTFIRKMRDAGVSAKDAQRMARHSTITLTLDVYEDESELEELGAAAAKLSGPIAPLTPSATLPNHSPDSAGLCTGSEPE